MKTPQSVLPDWPTLTKRLRAGLEGSAGNGNAVKVVQRTRPRFMSTLPNEIVTCLLPSGRRRRVFNLATLAEGKHWRGPIARRCEREYQRVRLPEGTLADSKRRLNAARMNLHFRWLGERPEKAVSEKNLWRYQHLRAAASMLGLI